MHENKQQETLDKSESAEVAARKKITKAHLDQIKANALTKENVAKMSPDAQAVQSDIERYLAPKNPKPKCFIDFLMRISSSLSILLTCNL